MIVLPLPVLRRLPTYLLLLEEDRRAGRHFVSSTEWAHRLGATPIQVRKDLSSTGAVGIPKRGFALDTLDQCIRTCLGKDNRRDVFLVGTSILGQGVASSPTLGAQGFSVVGVFDPVGRCSSLSCDHKQLAWDKFPDLVRRMGVSVVLLAVEAGHAQRITDKVVQAGITTVWNLTGRCVVAPGITVVNEDFGSRLAHMISRTDA
jgi:redox-sensing transcriptional repressor